MWRWRQNVLYNKHYFFKDIFVFVVGVHTLFLLLICVFDTAQLQPERFVLDAQHLQSTVVFMPLHKKVATKNQLSSTEKSSQKKLLHHDEYLALQKKEKSLPAKIEKNTKKDIQKNIKKEQKKDLPVEKKHEHTAKKVVEKNIIKNSQKNTIASKPAAVKENKVVEKKETFKPEVLPQLTATKLQQDEVKKEVTVVPSSPSLPVVQAAPILQNIPLQNALDENVDYVIDEDEISFVGRVDLELIQIKEMIHGQVLKFYRPPVGISKKAVCELSVYVGLLGKADRVIIEKSSGSLANDACARAALLQVVFPKEVIGKKIIIELGQS